MTAHRELGLLNYPKISDDEKRRIIKRCGSVPDIASGYLDIERSLRGEPPIVRGILWVLYAKRHAMLHTSPLEVEPHYRLHVQDFVDTIYGDLISDGERRTLERIAGKIKSNWCRKTILALSLDTVDGRDRIKSAV